MITRVPSGFSGYIWLGTKIALTNLEVNSFPYNSVTSKTRLNLMFRTVVTVAAEELQFYADICWSDMKYVG